MVTPEQLQQLQQIQTAQQPVTTQTPQAPDQLAQQADALSKQIASMLVAKESTGQQVAQGIRGAALGAMAPPGQNPANAVVADLQRQQEAQQAGITNRVQLLSQIRQQMNTNREAQQGQERLDIERGNLASQEESRKATEAWRKAEADRLEKQGQQNQIKEVPEGGKLVVFDKDGKVLQTIEGNPKAGTESSKQSKEMIVDGKRMQVTFDPKSGKYADPQGNDVTAKVQGEYHVPPTEPTNVVTIDDPKNPGKQIPAVVDRGKSTATPITIGGQQATKTSTAQQGSAAKQQQEYEQNLRDLDAMKELAAHNTGFSDAAFADRYFNIVKPGTGARMTKDNIDRLVTPGAAKDQLLVLADKLDRGQKLTPQDRNEIIKAATVVVNSKKPGGAATTNGQWSVRVKPNE